MSKRKLVMADANDSEGSSKSKFFHLDFVKLSSFIILHIDKLKNNGKIIYLFIFIFLTKQLP